MMADKKWSSKCKKFSDEELIHFYNLGLHDLEMSKEFKCSKSAVARRRWKLGLPSKRYTSLSASESLLSYKRLINKNITRSQIKCIDNPKYHNKLKETYRLYSQRPEVKIHKKEYNKKYLQRPEVKVKKTKYYKKYSQRPEVKIRNNLRRRIKYWEVKTNGTKTTKT